MKKIFFLLLIIASAAMTAQDKLPVGTILPTRDTPVHDPVMIKEKDTYYIFCTGFGISVWSSKDLKYWRKEAPVFSRPPQWAADTIPGFKGHIWAPDISYHNGQYYLYYTVSAFGKNISAIGVATNKTLDSSSSCFKWIDHGRVIQSYPGKTNWNAIDPNLIVDNKGDAFLSFGSFWDGLKLVKLTKDLLHPAGSLDNIPTIASRKKTSSDEDPSADTILHKANTGNNAIEAPFIFKKGSYYYLFASIDYCCKGEQSTYKVIIGRSKDAAGPYVDQEAKELRSGGGTILIQGNSEWYGAGHNGVCSSDKKDYIIYHGYDAKDKGRAKLLIRELKWNKDGWPVIVDL
jgi:arabinan endo-1,5-alpha-L-arabinosidase